MQLNYIKNLRKKIVSVSPIKAHFQDMYEISNNKLVVRNKKKCIKTYLFVMDIYIFFQLVI